jgi:hypothetical protein
MSEAKAGRILIRGRAYSAAPITVARDLFVMALVGPWDLPKLLNDPKYSEDEKIQMLFVKMATDNLACRILAGLVVEVKDGADVPFSVEWAEETATWWGESTNRQDHHILKSLILQMLNAFFGSALARSGPFADFFAKSGVEIVSADRSELSASDRTSEVETVESGKV